MQVTVLDTPSAARYLSLSKPTMERMRLEGDGPPFVKMGRSVRYRVSDLNAWMDARVATSTGRKVAA